MIFDSQFVTELVVKWQHSKDPLLLDLILDQSKSLIEAIVSGYDSQYREDLIQEANLRLQYALPFFDRNIANLHTYFTTVVKNICLTYLKRQSKYYNEYSIELFHYDTFHTTSEDSNYGDLLEDLVIRNRTRFPSIPVDIIDDASDMICDSLASDVTKRSVVSNIVQMLDIDKNVAEVIYTSSLLYLRSRYTSMAVEPEMSELSIYSDIINIFGKDIGTKISIILAGMTIRFP